MPHFPAVDGIQLPNRFYQYTVSLSHPIATHRFETTLQTLNLLDTSICLYFVVPASVYSRFTNQRYGKMDDVVQARVRLPSWTDNVTQYVVKLPLTRTIATTAATTTAMSIDEQHFES